MKQLVFVALCACGGGAATKTTTMSTFEINGYELTGAEYWPYAGSADINYPDDVLWGFYPEAGVVPPGETDPNRASARPEAVACAQKAYTELRAFLESGSAKFRRANELGAKAGFVVPRFYLWTNDYGRADSPFPPGERKARLWYWKRKEPAPPKPPGYWKWESSLLQNGACVIPQQAQIDAYLDQMITDLEHGATAPPASL